MPTHDDMPAGFDEARARRAVEIDEAEERARRERAELAAAKLIAANAARRATSVPPPSR